MRKLKIGFSFLLLLFLSCSKKEKTLTCSGVMKEYDNYKLKIKDLPYADSLYNVLQGAKKNDSGCIYLNLLSAEILSMKKKYNDAIKEYRAVIRKENSNVFAIYNLGRIYFLVNNYDSAISCFRFSLRLKGGNGYVFEKTDEFTKVIGVSNFEVSYKDIIFNNAKASYYGEYFYDANNEFKYCIENNIHLNESYYFLGLIYSKINEFGEACKYFKLAKENGNTEMDSLIKRLCNSI